MDSNSAVSGELWADAGWHPPPVQAELWIRFLDAFETCYSPKINRLKGMATISNPWFGAALVVLWATVVATIPAMQKGNDTARTIHIGANVLGLSFFAWQVTTGIPILLKVWEKTQWP